MEDNIVGIIPARGGSKGVPRKNIRPLAGKPLIYYSIVGGKKARCLNRLIVSTDDLEIADVAQNLRVEVILRPKDLATDDAPMVPVLKHVVTYLENEEGYLTDIVVVLQATTPFRRAKDIDQAVQLLVDTGADSVVSVCEAPHTCNPHWVMKIADGRLSPYLDADKGYARRQDLPKVYWRNGQIYAVKKEVLFRTNSVYGVDCRPYIMSGEYHINIDSELDFLLAELLLREKRVMLD